MTTITAKRHPLKFYTLVVFSTLVFCIIGTLLMVFSIDELQKGQPTIKDYFIPILGVASYAFAFIMPYAYWKNSPQIIADENSIKIGDQTFFLKDIKDIVLTGKMPFRVIMNFPMEGTAIIFKDGTEKILFDDMYVNSPELKLFLEHIVLKKKDYFPTAIKRIRKNEVRFEQEDTFKGNQFTSIRGISLWGIIVPLTFILFSRWHKMQVWELMLMVTVGIFWFIVHSWLMHYFGLTRSYLIVRNHNFIWQAKIYRLSDIKEVVFEALESQPNSMRIITNDYRNKRYPAGTLSDKTWIDLGFKLEAKGIRVRNECIIR
jgi:hypothetical protein